MNHKIRNLHRQIEHLKKENIDLNSKAKMTKLYIYITTLKTQLSIEKFNENILENNKVIKNPNFQLEK